MKRIGWSRTVRSIAAVAVAAGSGLVALDAARGGVPASVAAPPAADRGCDFDGDGFTDLAIGVPQQDVGAPDAGAVQVLYGSAVGATADRNQWWDQGSPGVLGGPEAYDRFGEALVCADFNGDGFDDLAIGVPNEDFVTYDLGAADVGAVQVLYGSAVGLTADANQWWFQDSPGVLGTNESYDEFGSSLATADFDGDGFADLAIGVPDEDLGDLYNAGAVQVLYGSAVGLTADGNQWWDQGRPGVLGGREHWDKFGSSLASGDFDGDGFDDLAIGVPNEDFVTYEVGAVQVLYGSAVGLTADRDQWWFQDSPGVLGANEGGDRFGSSLATADFDGDGYDDLAVGVPAEDFVTWDVGAVQVLYGSAVGLTADGNQWWFQDSPGVLGANESYDEFGSSLATADFDGDGFADLAIGVPREDLGVPRIGDAGAVQVLYGSAVGLTADRDQWWDQGQPGVLGGPETRDRFGWSLASGDFNGDGFDDLAIGNPFEDFVTRDVGAVQVLYGSAVGLTADGNQWWFQDSPGVLGTNERYDSFGTTLA